MYGRRDMNLQGKKVLVFGSGVSGIAVADLLEKIAAIPVIYDGNEQKTQAEILAKLEKPDNTSVILGNLSDEILESLDLVVLSPGVPYDLPIVDKFKERNLPVWGEIELAFRLGQGKVIAITGTNGKTTTTALTGAILEDYFESIFVVGNIGTPYTSAVLEMTKDSWTVAEVSSFQLETTHKFAPQISAILNITEDHLNRHHSMAEYTRVKEMITANQTNTDIAILNYEDEALRAFANQLGVKVVFFSSETILPEGAYLDGDAIILKTAKAELLIARTSELKILGTHNYENVMVAATIAYYAGVPIDNIRSSVRKFKAVEHRIEYVIEKDGVIYYNDSKGTNPDAAIKAIQAMNRPTILIGGGYDKQADYGEWIRAFDGKVKQLVLIGQTREKIEKEAHRNGFMDTILADSLAEAVAICTERAESGDAVLLSPACASWGQFENYEQRGEAFKRLVL